jgi:hypothetical protein
MSERLTTTVYCEFTSNIRVARWSVSKL